MIGKGQLTRRGVHQPNTRKRRQIVHAAVSNKYE